MTVIQMAGLSIIGTLLALQFKKEKAEFGIYIIIILTIFLFWGMKDQLAIMCTTIKSIQSMLPVKPEFIQILLKVVGITYIAEFASDICKDAGYQTISTQIEVFTKLLILAYSMPILEALLVTIKDLLQ